MNSIHPLDPLAYLHGSEYVDRKRQRRQRSIILKGDAKVRGKLNGGTTENNMDVPRHNNTLIPAEEMSRRVANIHISLVIDFLDRIQFPTYVQKNWRHPRSKQLDEDFQPKCLTLNDCLSPSGRQYSNTCKIWVVVLVCKGSTLCEPSPAHGPTSPRRFCGYGIRLFSTKDSPCNVIIEEFGSHTNLSHDLGWKMQPPAQEKVALSPSAIADAYWYI